MSRIYTCGVDLLSTSTLRLGAALERKVGVAHFPLGEVRLAEGVGPVAVHAPVEVLADACQVVVLVSVALLEIENKTNRMSGLMSKIGLGICNEWEIARSNLLHFG